MKKIKAFTLLEVLLSVVILSMFIGIIISIYTNLRKTDASIANKRILISEASDLMDKIHEAAINYNIDYEEYFNVQRQGNFDDIVIIVNGKDDNNENKYKVITGVSRTGFSTYGNTGDGPGPDGLYYCGNGSGGTIKGKTNKSDLPTILSNFYSWVDTCPNIGKIIKPLIPSEDSNGLGIPSGWLNNQINPGKPHHDEVRAAINAVLSGGLCMNDGRQKYLQYNFLHYKLSDCDLNSEKNSDSLQNVGPVAILPNTALNYLYLISNENLSISDCHTKNIERERYYFRQRCEDGFCWIETLKLEGIDAGIGVDYDSRGSYDGFIDSWMCDPQKGYICHGTTGYYCDDLEYPLNMPIDEYDGWQAITNTGKVNVSDFRIDIYPTTDPYLCNDPDLCKVMDPYAKITFTMNLIGYDDSITLSTIVSFKSSYSKFLQEEYPGYIPTK